MAGSTGWGTKRFAPSAVGRKRPSRPVPDPGGGHFGIQPRRAVELDPSGSLMRLWAEYRALYAEYESLRDRAQRMADETRVKRPWGTGDDRP